MTTEQAPSRATTLDAYAAEDRWFDFPDFYDMIVAGYPEFRTFVEVGVWKGHSVCHLGRRLRDRGGAFELHAVDLWHDDYSYKRRSDFRVIDAFRHNVMVAGLSGIVREIREDSAKAAERFADGSVDFVFIDADHEYEGVARDLDAWIPKLSARGVISGHDWSDHWPGVKRAVRERIESALGLPIRVRGHCWWTPMSPSATLAA